MDKKILLIIAVVFFVLAGTVASLAFIPSSAITGGPSVIVCDAHLSVIGTYNDALFARWISGFQVTAGSSNCHAKSALMLFPSFPSFAGTPQANIFQFTMIFTSTLTSSSGATHGPYKVTTIIPAGQTSYSFDATATVSAVPAGTYSFTVDSPLPIGSSGPSSYTTSVTIG